MWKAIEQNLVGLCSEDRLECVVVMVGRGQYKHGKGEIN